MITIRGSDGPQTRRLSHPGPLGIYEKSKETKLEAGYQRIGAAAYAAAVRQPAFGEGELDIRRTARAAKVRLSIEARPGSEGVYFKGYERFWAAIVIDRDLDLDERTFTFAHELGHHCLKELTGSIHSGVSGFGAEDFCEYFAAKLVDDPAPIYAHMARELSTA